jgi:ABC-2 type transport system permease protein
MTTDLRAVMWQEWKLLFRDGTRRTRTVVGGLTPLVLAVYVPLEAGHRWVSDPILPLLTCILTVMVPVLLTIPDTFAGERERHTIETSVARRLPDEAILFGKVLVSLVVALGVVVLVLAVGLVTVNIAHWGGGLLVYSPGALLTDLVVSFFFAVITAGAGVIVSLRAETRQDARVTLGTALLLAGSILGLIPSVLLAFRPEWGETIKKTLAAAADGEALLVLVGSCTVLAVGVVATAVRRFRREGSIH